MKTLVAVETSDLVKSTKLSHTALKEALDCIKQHHDEYLTRYDLEGISEYFRGDAYQVLYTKLDKAFMTLLLTKLALSFMLPARIGITQCLAIDYVDSKLESLSDNMQKPFVLSGRGLDSLSNGDIGILGDFANEQILLLTDFLNRILKKISAKQAEILYWYIKLDFPEQKVIAQRLNMTRQNVNTHLIRANADLIKRYIVILNSLILKLSRDS